VGTLSHRDSDDKSLFTILLDPPFPALPFVQVPEIRRQRMTVRAEQAQIALDIILRIAIDMVDLERDSAGDRILFMPAAHRTAFPILVCQITPDMPGNSPGMYADATAYGTILPLN